MRRRELPSRRLRRRRVRRAAEHERRHAPRLLRYARRRGSSARARSTLPGTTSRSSSPSRIVGGAAGASEPSPVKAAGTRARAAGAHPDRAREVRGRRGRERRRGRRGRRVRPAPPRGAARRGAARVRERALLVAAPLARRRAGRAGDPGGRRGDRCVHDGGSTKGLDTGAVYARASIPIGADETAGELRARLVERGTDLLRRTLAARGADRWRNPRWASRPMPRSSPSTSSGSTGRAAAGRARPRSSVPGEPAAGGAWTTVDGRAAEGLAARRRSPSRDGRRSTGCSTCQPRSARVDACSPRRAAMPRGWRRGERPLRAGRVTSARLVALDAMVRIEDGAYAHVVLPTMLRVRARRPRPRVRHRPRVQHRPLPAAARRPRRAGGGPPVERLDPPRAGGAASGCLPTRAGRPAHAAVSETVEGARRPLPRRAGFTNGVLRAHRRAGAAVARTRSDPRRRSRIPTGSSSGWKASSGRWTRARRCSSAMNEPASVTLRREPARGHPDAASARSSRRRGATSSAAGSSTTALVVRGIGDPARVARGARRPGTPQDQGSQAVVAVTRPAAGGADRWISPPRRAGRPGRSPSGSETTVGGRGRRRRRAGPADRGSGARLRLPNVSRVVADGRAPARATRARSTGCCSTRRAAASACSAADPTPAGACGPSAIARARRAATRAARAAAALVRPGGRARVLGVHADPRGDRRRRRVGCGAPPRVHRARATRRAVGPARPRRAAPPRRRAGTDGMYVLTLRRATDAGGTPARKWRREAGAVDPVRRLRALGAEVDRVAAVADLLHVDVMDGHFVPNLTIGPPVVAAMRSRTDLFLDCHLMVDNPGVLLDDFAAAGADRCIVHIELRRSAPALRPAAPARLGVGLVLNPPTPVEAVLPVSRGHRPAPGDECRPWLGRTGVHPRGVAQADDRARRDRRAWPRPRAGDRRGINAETAPRGRAGGRRHPRRRAARSSTPTIRSRPAAPSSPPPRSPPPLSVPVELAAARCWWCRTVCARNARRRAGPRSWRGSPTPASRWSTTSVRGRHRRGCLRIARAGRRLQGMVVTSGGTGFGPRDLTPEGTRMMIDREAPGLAEAMRRASDRRGRTFGMLGRGVCGTVGQALVCNLPGSSKGALECLEVILPAVPTSSSCWPAGARTEAEATPASPRPRWSLLGVAAEVVALRLWPVQRPVRPFEQRARRVHRPCARDTE